MGPISSTTGALALAGLLCLFGSGDAAVPQQQKSIAGIEVIQFPGPWGPGAWPQEVSNTLKSAHYLSDRFPDRLGFAYRDGNVVVLNSAGPLTDVLATKVATIRRKHPGVELRVRYVEHSQAELEAIQHDVVGVMRTGAVQRAGADPERNKVVLGVRALDEAFAQRVASTYPASAIAFRVADYPATTGY